MRKSLNVFLRKNMGNFVIWKHNIGAVRTLPVELLLCITELLKNSNNKAKTHNLL